MSFNTLARGLWRTMRPKQWTKNVFVFAALLFDGKLAAPNYLANTLAGFAILCLLSSTVYLVNDAVDAPADRLHPTKRNRPIARGDVTPAQAVVWAVLLSAFSLAAAFALNTVFGLISLSYLALMMLYSFKLKHVVIVDVIVISIGFVLRVAAGAPLVDAVRFSPWLYVCTLLGTLLVGCGKRRQEIVELNGNNSTRAILSEYNLPLLDQLIGTATTATVVSYALYTFSAPQLPANHMMMVTIPIVLYGLFRYLYLVHVKGAGGEPEEIILTDRPLQAAVVLWGLSIVLVLYVLAKL